MNISVTQGAFFVLVFFCVSLWEYIMFQRSHTRYPYREGFAVFSILQWLGVFLGMIGIFGWGWGIAAGIACASVLQYLCHFTLGPLWNKAAEANYLFPTVMFAVTVWVLLAFGIYHFV